jgi:hypothetical protein
MIVLACTYQEVFHLLLTSSCSLQYGAGKIPRWMLAKGDGKEDSLGLLTWRLLSAAATVQLVRL